MANALAPPNRNALYGPTESYGLPRQDRYGRFLIGGDLGLNTPAGQLDAAFEILPGVGDYRALDRAGDALTERRLVPDLMGGAKVEMPRMAEGIFEGVTAAPVIGDAATLLKMGAASLPGLLAMMARRSDDIFAKGMAPQARHMQGAIGQPMAVKVDKRLIGERRVNKLFDDAIEYERRKAPRRKEMAVRNEVDIPKKWYHGSRDGVDLNNDAPLWMTDSRAEAERYARGGPVYEVTPDVKPVEVSSTDMIQGQFGDNNAITRQIETPSIGNRPAESSRWMGIKNTRGLKPEHIKRLSTPASVADDLPMGKGVRYTDKATGGGLMNRQNLDLDRLTDDEYDELIGLWDLGLQQPVDVPPEARFAFTPEGEQKHSRLIELLKKSSKNGVVREEIEFSGKPVWSSNDGQIAYDPIK